MERAIGKAREALQREDAIAAEVELKRALAAGARAEAVAALMGEAKLVQQDHVAARKWLGSGAFTRDTASHGWRMLSRLELAEQNLPAARNALDRALAFAPRDPELWVDIGRLSYRMGRQDDAVRASAQALELGPENIAALNFRGQLQRDSAGLRTALPWFERALEKAPDDLGLLGEYAATLGELGRAKEMLKVTRRMIELDERNPRAFYLQAVLAARAGRFGLAERLLWRAGGDMVRAPAGQLLSGALELQAGHGGLAVERLGRLAAQQPGNERVQLLFASALARGRNWSELVERFAPLADRQDASPYLLTLVGRAYEVLGKRAEAARYLDRATRPVAPLFHPIPEEGNIEVLAARWQSGAGDLRDAIAYVRALLAAGAARRAVGAAEAALERFSGSYDARLLAGDARLLAGDAAGAFQLYQEAATIRQPFALARRSTFALDRLGRNAEAQALMEAYLSQHPRSGDALLLLAERTK